MLLCVNFCTMDTLGITQKYSTCYKSFILYIGKNFSYWNLVHIFKSNHFLWEFPWLCISILFLSLNIAKESNISKGDVLRVFYIWFNKKHMKNINLIGYYPLIMKTGVGQMTFSSVSVVISPNLVFRSSNIAGV